MELRATKNYLDLVEAKTFVFQGQERNCQGCNYYDGGCKLVWIMFNEIGLHLPELANVMKQREALDYIGDYSPDLQLIGQNCPIFKQS